MHDPSGSFIRDYALKGEHNNENLNKLSYLLDKEINASNPHSKYSKN